MAKKKPLRFVLKVEIDLVPDGPSYVYHIKGNGTQSFVCPDHATTRKSIRDCVLSNVVFLLEEYALEDDEKLSLDAQDMKRRLLELATVGERR
jgi:hypothetical protein